ncbi:MAG: ASKHA domain-containing protein [Candidatus Thorarchaeota archaeon]
MSIQSKYGVAVDIGTTNVTLNLVNLETDSIVNQYLMRNPQHKYGIDIISRITYATKNSENQQILVRTIRDAINKAIVGLLKEKHIKPSRITDAVIVGNTVMHHLFFDLNLDSLLKPPYKATGKGSILISASEVGLDCLPNARCYGPPIVESFIGSDAIAVILESRYLETKDFKLTIDVGTNTEVALITPQGTWIASGASGPAFEGWTIECGMGGEIGAIESVSINNETYEPTISIIGGGNPRGICGTGSVSVMAALLDSGLLLSRGSFKREIKTKWLSFESNVSKYILAFGDISSTSKDIVMAQTDLRMLQQSKAAIRAVIEMLLKKSNSTSDQITEVYLTGVFGTNLNIDDAYRIGLFPRFENASITQVRNGAIKGAGLLLSEKYRTKAEQIAKKLNYIELTEEEEFRDLFVSSLHYPSK